MKITRLHLKDFRVFGDVLLENLPDRIVLVAPNGLGKSSILEAIAGAQDLIAPYQGGPYQVRQKHPVKGQMAAWPPHLRDPVRIGASEATIELTVRASEHEAAILLEKGTTVTEGTVAITLEAGRFVANVQPDKLASSLFSNQRLQDKIGFVDYHRPFRAHPRQGVGDPTAAFNETQIRNMHRGFQLDWNDQTKFSMFKSFVVAMQVSDSTHSRRTGEPRDSLEPFRRVFDEFFAPKQFIGPDFSDDNTKLEVLVNTPFGSHDIDVLSDGEKELLQIFGHLFRFRDRENIVLWDTPELHLNAALEARLYDSLEAIAPSNQYWIATHSLELIDSVPPENVYVMRPGKSGVTIENQAGQTRKSKIRVYRELGARVGLQLVASLIVFIEGKESHSDKRILERLFESKYRSVSFVASGSCETVLAAGSRANDLLHEACTNGDFLAVVDRDYRQDDELEALCSKYQDRLFVWPVHELENVFLNTDVVLAVLQLLGNGDLKTPDAVSAALLDAAKDCREWIAADWIRWELHRDVQHTGGRISRDDPYNSLKEFADRLRHQNAGTFDQSELRTRFDKRLDEIDRHLMSRVGLDRLPGKQILERFVDKHTNLSREQFVDLAVGVILEKKLVVPAMVRLEHIILQRLGQEE